MNCIRCLKPSYAKRAKYCSDCKDIVQKQYKTNYAKRHSKKIANAIFWWNKGAVYHFLIEG